MMRAISIIAIVFCLIFMIGTVAFIHETLSARSAATYEMINSYASGDSESSDNSMYDSYESEARNETRNGAIFSLVMLVFLDLFFLLSLLKIKTKTMKIISIIGLSLGGILLFFSFVPISSPGNVSFDECGGLFTVFGIISLVFFIIGTIHAFRKKV